MYEPQLILYPIGLKSFYKYLKEYKQFIQHSNPHNLL